MAKKKEKAVEEPKVEKSKSKPQYLGGRLIVQIRQKTIGTKVYNDVIMGDGTGKLLSDKDLEAQVTDKQGELIH